MEKTCTRCAITQSLDNFYLVKRDKPKVRNVPHDDRKAMCKTCYTQRAKEWAAKNKEKRKEIADRWAKNNPDKVAAIQKRTREKPETKLQNKEWRSKNAVAYHRKKRAEDPMFALRFKLRSMVNKAVHRFGYTKRSRTQETLGCSWAEFVLHIERLFQPGMTWENRGEWHIDHIIPLASAKTEEDVIRLNHYTNLQPLWAEDNLRKSDKLPHQL